MKKIYYKNIFVMISQYKYIYKNYIILEDNCYFLNITS